MCSLISYQAMPCAVTGWTAPPAIQRALAPYPSASLHLNNCDLELFSVLSCHLCGLIVLCGVPGRGSFVHFLCLLSLSLPPFLVLYFICGSTAQAQPDRALDSLHALSAIPARLCLHLPYPLVAGSGCCLVFGFVPAAACSHVCLSIFVCWTLLVSQCLDSFIH